MKSYILPQMLTSNPLQFAITREDPSLEAELINSLQAREVLLVCSGGDTVLALKSLNPALRITAFDMNPFQIQHLIKKSQSRSAEINSEKNRGLCQTGNFESLFRQWRLFFNEFILSVEKTIRLFTGEFPLDPKLFNSKYWPVAFDLHFSDSILLAMFGEAAIQHAPRGSYPRYFQQAFERGLKRSDFKHNPFLQHIFLGEYLEVPGYLSNGVDISDVELIEGTLFDVPDLGRFDFIQLSNIFDWSSTEEIKKTCSLLNQQLKPGTTLLVRQINNESPIGDFLGSNFELDEKCADQLFQKDLSLFYSKFVVARKKV